MDNKELLEKRKKLKSRKPDFVRQDFHKKRLKKKWVRPRGLQSKVRLRIKDKPRRISTGWGSPKAVKGLHPSGLREIIVSTISEVENVNKDTEGIVLRRTVGKKKRIEIIKVAIEKGIKILNIKDPNQFIKDVEAELSSRKEKKKKLKEKREKKKKEEKGKKEEKLADKLTDDEKKEKDKQEKDKVLTKKV